MKKLLLTISLVSIAWIGSAQSMMNVSSSDELVISGNCSEINLNDITGTGEARLIVASLVDSDDRKISQEIFDRKIYDNGCFRIPQYITSGTYVLKVRALDKTEIALAKEVNVINAESFNEKDLVNDSQPKKVSSKSNGATDLLIKGSVQDYDNNSLVLLNTFREESGFEYAKVDENGKFQFTQPIVGTTSFIVYHVKEEGLDNEVKIETNPYQMVGQRIIASPYKLPKGVLSEEVIRAKIIESNYPTSVEHEEKNVTSFGLIFDKEYQLNEYFEQSNTVDIINEIVSLKRFKQKNDKAEMRLLNSRSNFFFDQQPLFIIDGFIVDGINSVLELAPESIEKIQISYDPIKNSSTIGRLGRNGIFAVTTYKQDYHKNNPKLVRVEGISLQ